MRIELYKKISSSFVVSIFWDTLGVTYAFKVQWEGLEELNLGYFSNCSVSEPKEKIVVAVANLTNQYR